MTNNIPDISFITICYNGFKDTCELIESLHKNLQSVSYEIIVIDNASREDEAAKIQKLYPTVVAIRSDINGGFSGGNNIGIRAAKGKYLFLINNDTYIESDDVSYLIERLESRPEIGGVSPKIRFAFPPQPVCGVHPPVTGYVAQHHARVRLSGRRKLRHSPLHPLSSWSCHDDKTRSHRKGRHDA